jgi:hydroxyethylthiazole kinase-like sugar kinase family protein
MSHSFSIDDVFSATALGRQAADVVVIMGATDYVSDGTQHAAKCNDSRHLADRFRLTRFARISQD